MKAVPKVSTDCLYIEDVIADDAFTGVVPIYTPINPKPPADPAQNLTEDEELEKSTETEIAGYIVGVPLAPGFFRPRFDIVAWQAYQDDLIAEEKKYSAAYSEWASLPEEERGEPPQQTLPELPNLWIEGLTPEEIEEITRPQPEEPTEVELLSAKLEEIRQQNAGQQEAIENSELGIEELMTANTEQLQTILALGSEQVKQDLSTLDLKQQNDVIGGELVKKDISILDLFMQNQVLGQMLAALELKLLANGTGGESDVQQ
ncbi:hypothetical protein JJQ72_02305 [Paenibacillus sp. F411]|uniref:hypothetical protein n=1 Tax=Paenibacillus sp. F411 TaxID=2820239 RepID=UPI001AAE81C4|nr:hypothetical protein [Paenibacillus sp. F411]MBO2942817.1 hypothetical protein [Paenibacillus sp. F411]